MPIPHDIQTAAEVQLDRYCVRIVPEHAYDKVRIGYIVKGMAITLFEERPGFRDKTIWERNDIVRIRYSKKDALWTLYCRDRNLEWHIYGRMPPTPNFSKILEEIESDPTGIFWG